MIPTIAPTISIISSAAAQNANQISWNSVLTHPVTLAIISSGVVGIIIVAVLKYVFKLGETSKEFTTALQDIGSLKTGVEKIEHCIIEIQTIMKQKYAKSKLDFTHSISKYGVAHSPIVLKKN